METFNFLLALLKAVPWSLALTISSFGIGALLAIPLCMMRISKRAGLRAIALSITVFIRSIPPIVWLFFIFFSFSEFVVQLNAFVAAMLGLGLITAANLAEIYRGALQAIPAGQREASHVLGLSFWDRASAIMVPQVFRYSLPACSTYAIGLLKDTAIASTIGVPEMAQVAYQISQQTFKGLEIYALAGGLYLVISFAMAWLSRSVDAGLRARIER
jgi:polar amino acid transport system permease protein